MPIFLSPQKASTTTSVVETRGGGKNMEIKIKSLVRRQLIYGFEAEKDGDGEVIGTSVVKLARRNAFELVGLRRPALVPGWRFKMI